MPREDTRHWNDAGLLHPVDLYVQILVPADTPIEVEGKEFRIAYPTAVRAKRETYLENRDQPRVYVDENGYVFTGKFKWAYH